MKKFLRAFKTQAEYLAYSASTEFELDNVCSCREGDLVYYNSEQCGGQGIHRTISGETYCDGYDKRVYIYKQVSYDDGVTWETTATTSALVEKDSEDCGYVPPTPPPSSWDIIAKFNVTDASNPIRIASATTNFSKIEIDGVEQPSVVSEYTFSTTGEHTVKYELSNKNIGTEAFSGCSDMTSCSIGDNVTAIGSDAFDDCTSLTSCTIGSGVTSIGDWAFWGCTSLTSIDIPDGVTSIGKGAFGSCSDLTSVNIPSGVTTIGQSTFNGCSSLTSIDIPNSLTNIGNFAFSACTNLTSIVIPDSVTSIGFSAFTSCSGLTSITVNSNNTEYDSRNNCNAIIETSANTLIQGCKNTIIPNSVTTIGNGAFENCSSLTSIVIPNSVTRIYHDVFRGCSSLTSIDIPNSVTSIGGWAFDNCTSLTSCTIGSGVTTIGDYVFYQCSGLTSVTVNATTPPTLGSSVFIDTNNCPIYVPCDSVDAYKAAANWSTYASRIQAIPGSCPPIVTAKFNVTDTSSRTRIASGTSSFTKIEIDGVEQPSVATSYTFNTTGEHIVKYYLTDASIGVSAFQNCSSLTNIDISDNVTSIGINAFRQCSGLTSIDIPSGVTSIGYDAFRDCSSLTSITVNSNNSVYDSRDNCNAIIRTSTNTLIKGCKNTIIPNSITTIGDYAFGYCSGLTSITIPNSVTQIYGDAFEFCSGLTSIAIPDSVTSIGGWAFQYCTSLTSCTIGSGVTSIGKYVFYECSGLTSINIPSGVTSIGDYAFDNCSSLTSIDIPDSVTSIGEFAFDNCYNLTSVTVNATTPPTLGNYAFRYTNNCQIHVPCSSVDTYKAATNWSSYASRIQAIYAEPITNAVVTCDNATYNGAVQTAQNITVTLSGETLVANTDYTITSNTGGTNAGNYAVVVGGIGCYSGTSNGTFTIAKADSSLLFTVTNLTVGIGETKTNAVTVNAGDGTVTYVSSDQSIVIVDNNGNVSGVSNGDTTVSANISSTSNYNSATTSYNVVCAIVAIAKFNVTSTTSPTRIASVTTGFSRIEIDGVVQPSVVSAYTFSTTGEHTVKYYLKSTSIGNNAFQGCSGLTSIDIPDSVTSIGTQAFRYCSGLTSCTIGSGVTSIGESAFAICSSLTRLNSNVDGVFNIPSGVTSIGNYAFQACSGMTSIDIPSGVTSIGSMTFYNCSSLTSIDIPSGVTIIGNYVFYNCYSLTSIVCNATTAPTITNDTLQNVKTSGTLTVPIGSTGYDAWLSQLSGWTKVEQ